MTNPHKLIHQAVQKSVTALKLPKADFAVEHPNEKEHGDYASNAALAVFKKGKFKNPRELAEHIKSDLEKNREVGKIVESIEIAGAGFINFTLKPEWLVKEMGEIIKKEDKYGSSKWLKKKILVEYTDPNPFKEFHIGHLMSNCIGEAIARILESSGGNITRICYQGDTGIHIAKAIWGWQKKRESLSSLKKKPLKERINFLGQAYALGDREYDKEKGEIDEVSKKIYERSDKEINQLYEEGKKWSLEYFETIYKKLGTKFDCHHFESETGKLGVEIVEKFLKKNLFIKSEGAIIFPGEKYGLHNRVFINSQGIPTYEAKELGLAKLKDDKHKYDLSIVVTGNEVKEYFKVVLKAMELTFPKIAEKIKHLPHGMLKLTSGKMSSRTGNIVAGESLINELSQKALKMSETKDQSVADKIAVAAIKHSMLKQGIGRDITFNEKESLSFEGDTGPYLQYTYARARSVIRKSKEKKSTNSIPVKEELDVLKLLYRFPEVVEKAAQNYSPHLVCSYLFDLAQSYNTFYGSERIVGSDKEKFRVDLTRATAQVIHNGLRTLGIETIEKM